MRSFVVILIFASQLTSSAVAQKPSRLRPQDVDVTSVTRPFRAAYIIEPLVHRVRARRGQLVRFEFQIAANAKRSKLNIGPVAMKQQQNGAMLLDSEGITPDVLRVTSEKNVDLALAEFHTISCELRVPPVNTPFLSYGILVKELPQNDAPDPNADRPTIGVKFLTQYLLRIDLEVIGVTGESLTSIDVEGARIVERDGNAIIQTIITNPTDSSMNFQMRSVLVSKSSGKQYRSGLYMPCRSGMDPPDKFDSRILSETTLLMEGQLTDAVFPGEFDLNIELLHGGRLYKKASFPVAINAGDFPAQDATIVRVARDISVEPAHVKLSLQKGGKRMQSMTITNESQQTVIASLEPKKHLGELAEWVSFRPNELTLGPGRSRKVLVMLGPKRDFTTHSYAFAELSVRPEQGKALGTQKIPVALLVNSDASPQVTTGAMAWALRGRKAGFEIPVRNAGQQHLELSAEMVLQDEFGRGFTMQDGYGRWILPGGEDTLWFALPQMPPPGNYQVDINIAQGEGQPPFTMTQNIELKSATSRTSEAASDGATR